MRYKVQDMDGRQIIKQTFFETHSRFILIKTFFVQFYPSKKDTYTYVGLSNGQMFELGPTG